MAKTTKSAPVKQLNASELTGAVTFGPHGTSVPGDYIKLQNQWARVMIQLSPYHDDERGVFIVSGDTKDSGREYRTSNVTAAYRYALESLALYAKGRA